MCVESGRVGDVGEQVVEVSGPGLVVAEEAEGAERPAVVGALRGGAEDVRGGVAEEDGAVASRGLRPGEAVVSGAGEEAKAVERAVGAGEGGRVVERAGELQPEAERVGGFAGLVAIEPGLGEGLGGRAGGDGASGDGVASGEGAEEAELGVGGLVGVGDVASEEGFEVGEVGRGGRNRSW